VRRSYSLKVKLSEKSKIFFALKQKKYRSETSGPRVRRTYSLKAKLSEK